VITRAHARFVSRKPLLAAAVSCALTSGALGACGATGGTDAPLPAGNPSAGKPVALQLSARATDAGRRAGRTACAGVSPRRALTTFARRATHVHDPALAPTRKALLTRGRAALKTGSAAPDAAPVSAALFAISQPQSRRAGAYAGCLSELSKENSR
jgi:hypothetical protein